MGEDSDDAAQIIEATSGFLAEVVGTECRDTFGYEDVHPGSQVIVKDGDGSVVATTRLSSGTFVEGLPITRTACEFTFEAEVPEADFYTVEVAGREGPTFSREELDALDWEVGLELGD